MELECICANCFEFISPGRWNLGYRLCLSCGEKYAKGDPLPKPVKAPLTKEQIKAANEIRAIENAARKKAVKKLADEHERSIKRRKLKELDRLKKKYGEK
jgi:hypothetical protein